MVKTALTVVFGLIVILLLVGFVAWRIGASLPVNHTATVEGTVEAPPAKVFAIITNVANEDTWRKGVKSVQMLAPVNGQDHWTEDLGRGSSMTFTATRTNPPLPDGNALREVHLDVPSAAYGGTWTYKLSPGPAPNTTTLQITEAGFIKPPIYRFVMARVLGITRNLDQYLRDIQAEAMKP